MSNWTIVLAFAAFVACARIDLSLCQVSDKLLQSMRGANMEKVEEILKSAPDGQELVTNRFTVDELLRISSPTIESCGPKEIERVVSLLSDRILPLHHQGLLDYVQHYYIKNVKPLCANDIKQLARKHFSLPYSTELARRFKAYGKANFPSTKKQIKFENQHGRQGLHGNEYDSLRSDCNRVCALYVYIGRLNRFGTVVPELTWRTLLANWDRYLGVCKTVSSCSY